MSGSTSTYERKTIAPRVTPMFGSSYWRIVERNFLVYRASWPVFVTGILEPILYLASIGIGVSKLVDDFTLADGTTVGYVSFIAPAMLATSAMNGVLFDSTYNIFFKIKFDKLYDTMLATPLQPWDIARGEITWALLRGGFYSTVFVIVMLAWGLIGSWWALLALPVTVLIGYGFAGAGMALTTWMRSWQDFDYIQLAIMPMFLFSGTFYPPPESGVWHVLLNLTPLYHGVELTRGCILGVLDMSSLISVAYLFTMGTVGLLVASRRIGVLLLK